MTINGGDIGGFVIACRGKDGGSIAYAASELQRYIGLTVGVTLPIETVDVPQGTKRILLDCTLITDDDSTFRIFTDSDGLVIAGDSRRGIIYAVYHFLEKVVGWRFFTSDTETPPKTDSIDLVNLDYTFTHPYKVRNIYCYDYADRGISLKRYQNGDGKCGDLSDVGGTFVYCPNGIHTFGRLSETGEGADPNPCLNSPVVRENMLRNIRDFLRSHPEARTVHVSQNDSHEYCTCPLCRRDLEEYSSPAGSIIKLMNFLAEELHEEFPHVYLVTFAYRYSFPAPVNITCHDNVVVEIAPLDLCSQHPLSEGCRGGDGEKSCTAGGDPILFSGCAMDAIRGWKKICRHFCLYDYGADFRYYYSPFPNFDVLLENYKVFNSLGAWGYVNLCNPHMPSAEFGDLRNYLCAKLTEEADMTKGEYEAHIDEFLAAFYGRGWREIRWYFDLLHTLAKGQNRCFTVYSSPEEIFGEHALAPYSDELTARFDRAEESAQTEVQRTHVKRLRISMDYLRIGAVHAREMGSGDEKRIRAITEEVAAFHKSCRDLGLNWITESHKLPETVDYKENPRTWRNDVHGYMD